MVAHLIDGWELVDYTWSPKTGVGRYTYERKNKVLGGAETAIVDKAQPYHPSHIGWYMIHKYI